MVKHVLVQVNDFNNIKYYVVNSVEARAVIQKLFMHGTFITVYFNQKASQLGHVISHAMNQTILSFHTMLQSTYLINIKNSSKPTDLTEAWINCYSHCLNNAKCHKVGHESINLRYWNRKCVWTQKVPENRKKKCKFGKPEVFMFIM